MLYQILPLHIQIQIHIYVIVMYACLVLYMLEFLNVAKSSNGSNQKSTYFRGMKVPYTYSTLNLSMKKMQCKNTLCFVNS